MARELTIKQRKFLKEYFRTGNGTLSALKVYDTDDYQTASEIASQNLRKLKIPMRQLMEAKGLSVGKLIETVDNALSAERIVTSPTEPDRIVPDHLIRLKAVDRASKWLGVDEPAVVINQQFNQYIKGEQEAFDV